MYRFGLFLSLLAMLVGSLVFPGQVLAQGTLVLWHALPADQLPAVQQVIDLYSGANPDVQIQLVNKTSADILKQDLEAVIPFGNGPDIIILGSSETGDLAVRNLILPLNAQGVTADFMENTFEPQAVGSVSWEGKTWGLPFDQAGIALVYNKDLVSPGDLPSSANDFAGLKLKADAFLLANPGTELVCSQAFGEADAYHAAPIFFGAGVPDYIDDTGKTYIHTSESLDAANWILEMKSSSEPSNTFAECRQRFLEGEVGMWWTGPWALPDIVAAGIDYGVFPMGKPFVGTTVLFLARGADSRGTAVQAIDFMKFFTNVENSKSLSLANDSIPANSAALNSAEIQAVPWMAAFADALASGQKFTNNPYVSCIWGPVGNALVEIWDETATPETALIVAESEIQTCVNGIKAQLPPRSLFLPLLIH